MVMFDHDQHIYLNGTNASDVEKLLKNFSKSLTIRGRGSPGLILRYLDNYILNEKNISFIAFKKHEIRSFVFYSELKDVTDNFLKDSFDIENLSQSTIDVLFITVYCMIDWLIKNSEQGFTAEEVFSGVSQAVNDPLIKVFLERNKTKLSLVFKTLQSHEYLLFEGGKFHLSERRTIELGQGFKITNDKIEPTPDRHTGSSDTRQVIGSFNDNSNNFIPVDSPELYQTVLAKSHDRGQVAGKLGNEFELNWHIQLAAHGEIIRLTRNPAHNNQVHINKIKHSAEEKIDIGRSPDNDIQLFDLLVSRFHARIIYSDNHWCVHDLNTPNGTSVNEFPIEGSQELFSGDAITIGKTVLKFTEEK